MGDSLQDRQHQAGYGLGVMMLGFLVSEPDREVSDREWDAIVEAFRFVPGFEGGILDADDQVTGVQVPSGTYEWWIGRILQLVVEAEDVEAKEAVSHLHD